MIDRAAAPRAVTPSRRGLTLTTINSATHGEVAVGSVIEFTKQYTAAEVLEFYRLAGTDLAEAPAHLPYLLAIAPLTKLGGDLNYLSGRMDWSAARPIGCTEAVTAQLEVTRLEAADGMAKIAFDARLKCGDEVVISGRSKGFVIPGEGLDVIA